MKHKQSNLEPVSAEDLNNFYGCSGHGTSCPSVGDDDYYNEDCCWHDCGNPGEIASKFWTAWN